MKIYLAPVQGHTDAAYRHFHAKNYVPADGYFTPFIRLEHGEVRKKDLNDLHSSISANEDIIPQVIFKDIEELRLLVEVLKSEGFRRIDINMGCPFPLQTAKGRGAATVGSRKAAEAVREVVLQNPGIQFSVKMRLGMERNDEWKETLPILNKLPLVHITLHPRVARQQYKGEPDLEAFAEFLAASEIPVVYNGDIRTPDDAKRIIDRFPNIAGIMIGRGLLARPSLTSELKEGTEWAVGQRLDKMVHFHRELLDFYKSTLCGDHQILSKIQPFWEYSELEIGRKPWKAIMKAVNLPKYLSAVATVGK